MSRSKLEGAGYKARRYRKRPNETSNSEVKETMKVSITAKRAVILFMTMALAVAMVACSGAVGKTGEPGPKGEPGDTAPPAPPANLAPFSNVPFDPIFLVEEGPAYVIDDLNAHFHDPEGQTLTFAAKAVPKGVVTAVIAGSSLTVEAIDADITEKVTATITVTATDTESSGTATIAVTVDPEGMVPARYNETLDPHVALMPGQEHTIEGSKIESAFEENEGESLSYSSSVNEEGASRVRVTQAADNTFTITALADNLGDATVTITATDEDNLPSDPSYVLTVSVVASFDPVPVGTIPTPDPLTAGGDPEVIDDVSMYFSDPKGGDLDYDAESSDDAVAIAVAVGSKVTITPMAMGTATVKVTATNSHDLSATQTISVTVDPAPVAPPAVPTLKKEFPIVTFAHNGGPQTFTLTDHFNNATDYRVVSNDTTVVMAELNNAKTMLTLTRAGTGDTSVDITPINSGGEEGVTRVISVTVEAAREVPKKPTLKPGKDIPTTVRVTAIARPEGTTGVDTSDAAMLAHLNASEKDYDLRDLIKDPERSDDDLEFMTETNDPATVAVYADPDDTGVDGTADERGAITKATLDKKTSDASHIRIRGRKAGTAKVSITASSDSGQSMTWEIEVTVVSENSAPTAVTTGNIPAGTIKDLDGTPVSTRMDVGNVEKVIDDKLITALFEGSDFLRGDMLTFELKVYPNGTETTSIVGTDSRLLKDGDPGYEPPHTADKAQVSGTVSPPMWTGSRTSKMTVTLTALRGNTADQIPTTASEATDVVAIIATDRFGLSAVQLINVRVNHTMKDEGAQEETPRKLSGKTADDVVVLTAGTATNNNGVLEMTWDSGTNGRTITLIDTGAGYFHDPDGDPITCSYTRSPAEPPVTDPVTPTPVATVGLAANVLTITPTQATGTLTVIVTCKETLAGDGSDILARFGPSVSDTLMVRVTGKTFSQR